MSMQGVQGEDRIELNKEEAQAIKLRSRRLLFSLVRPIKKRLAVSFALVVVSQALRVLGPGLIAVSIDWALPQAIAGNATPLLLTAAAYLFTATSTGLLIAWFLLYAAKTNQGVI